MRASYITIPVTPTISRRDIYKLVCIERRETYLGHKMTMAILFEVNTYKYGRFIETRFRWHIIVKIDTVINSVKISRRYYRLTETISILTQRNVELLDQRDAKQRLWAILQCRCSPTASALFHFARVVPRI